MSKNMVNEAPMGRMRDWSKIAFSGRLDSTPRVEIERWAQGWSAPRRGRSTTNGPLCIGGRVFRSGLGTHADSEIVLKLSSPGRRLCALAGMDHNIDSLKFSSRKERMVFSVEVEGRELFASEPLGLASAPREIRAELNGAKEVRLKVREINGDIGYAHADWADIRIELENGTVVPLGLPEEKQQLQELPPISFTMGGQSSLEVLARSRFTAQASSGKDGISRRNAVWRDPVTGLTVTLDATEYADFPAVEYILHLENHGQVDTPVIEDILSADFPLPVAAVTSTLCRSRGSTAVMEDFLYSKEPLEPGAKVRMTSIQGRSSVAWLPFFNIEAGNRSFLMAIGWSGSWQAEFNRVDHDWLRVRAGMERTRIALRPGEEVRLPGILLLFWEGQSLDGHNLLRQFMVRHGTPRPGGRPPVVPVSFVSWGGTPTAVNLERIAKLQEERLDCDCYWVEAGWYGHKGTQSTNEISGEWLTQAGNWCINPDTHPNGLRPISDAARKAGMKFTLWIEPERATPGSALHKEHPEWFLGSTHENARILLNLGIPEARRWATDFVSAMITRQGMDIFRQDFNMDPLPKWRAADAPDRQGVTEIRHIEGLYAFWDELLQRHPNLLIDNTASGGRRIDLETLRRSVPMWRSDYPGSRNRNPIGKQIHGIGLSYWIPYSATTTFARPNDTYDFRSGLAAGISLVPLIDKEGDGMPKDYPWPWLRTMIAQLISFSGR